MSLVSPNVGRGKVLGGGFFFFFFFDSMNEAPKNVFGLINLRNSLKNDFGSQMYMIKEISTSVPERRWQQRCEKPRKRFL